MSLIAVIKALHDAGIQPTGREIAEALWLAQHLPPRSVPTTESRQQQALTDEIDDRTVQQTPPMPSPAEPVPLSTTSSAVKGSQVRGHPVGIPDIPGLRQRQEIQRALRPLRRYGPSRRHRIIDEDATATFIANTGVWTPVMRPAPERWFDIVLAVDSSPSMDLWRPLISDLRAVLTGTGAFRDVRTWRLRPQQQAMILPPSAQAAARSPRELIDGAGRRLFFVVTDGAAHGWHDGSATKVLADWSKTGPVAVLQPLPEQMWTRTGLAAMPVRLTAQAPGAPNSQLHADYRRRRIPGIPIPVLGIEPNAVHSWARLVAGSASAVPLAATPANSDQPALSSLTSQNESGSAMDRFRASASPPAYRLAVCLSAVPLTLPIMRLVQHVAVPAANPSALAEVILGGLISRTGDNTYEFLPGIREALLTELRRSEMAMVFSAISDYITQHAGKASQTFAAIAESADGPVAADAQAFSWVPSAVAARLGLPTSPQYQKDQRPEQAGPPGIERRNERTATSASTSDQDMDVAQGNVPAGATHTETPAAAVIHDDVSTAAPARSAYLMQVRRIAPLDLTGREAELAELARFCLEPDQGPYAFWQAGPWAGKTALMSWFVLHPPPGVQLVSFFVTARLAAQDTRYAFTEALLEQLADLTGQELPAVLPEATQEAYLLDLLAQAAQEAQRAGGRLVLVVDGLDEDRGVTTGPNAHSIAGLLPGEPSAGMRVIVAGRPNPPLPDDVPDWHPLRDPAVIRPLAASPHAGDVERLGRQELQQLLRDGGAGRDLVGLLTAARGGLSSPDLAGLTGVPLWEVEEILQTAAGRTFTRRSSRWAPETGPQLYMFAHEELLAAAARYLEVSLPGYYSQLNVWAETYRDRGWPPGTPEYLLNDYFRLLAILDDVPRMLALTLDSLRQDRMLDFTGSDEAISAEVTTIAGILSHSESDPAAMAQLAALLETIEQRNANVPVNLPAAWAALGQTGRAESLAHGIADPDRQAQALSALVQIPAAGPGHPGTDDSQANEPPAEPPAEQNHLDLARDPVANADLAAAAAQAGDLDRAEALAYAIADPGQQAQALAQVAIAAAQAGDPGRAEALAYAIADPGQQAQALTLLAIAAAQAGDPGRAEALAYAIADPGQRAQALTLLAIAAAQAGDLDRAGALARAITDPYWQAQALAQLAVLLAQAGQREQAAAAASQAETAARAIADPGQHAQALAQVAIAAAQAGDPGRAEDLARAITDPYWQAQALAQLALVLAQAGRREQAAAVASQAEAAARAITDPGLRAQALAQVAIAAAQAGDLDRAGALARTITDPGQQAQALAQLAVLLAQAGQREQAAAVARQAEAAARAITNPYRRAEVLTQLAAAATEAGDLDHASLLAGDAEALARTITNAARERVLGSDRPDTLTTRDNLTNAEQLARSIHGAYVAMESAKGETPTTNPSMVPWEELPENLRQSSVARAADIGVKMEEIGAIVVPESASESESAFAFTSQEIEHLAEREHQRWVREMIAAGWKYGQPRDDVRKIHPDLQEWDYLSEANKEWNRYAISTLPETLHDAGYQILRLSPPTY
jgi:hypothetical protein